MCRCVYFFCTQKRLCYYFLRVAYCFFNTVFQKLCIRPISSTSHSSSVLSIVWKLGVGQSSLYSFVINSIFWFETNLTLRRILTYYHFGLLWQQFYCCYTTILVSIIIKQYVCRKYVMSRQHVKGKKYSFLQN